MRGIADKLAQEYRAYVDEPVKRYMLRAQILRPYQVRRFHSFGRYSIIHRPDWVYGAHQIAIGERVLMLHGGWLSVERPAWHSETPVLQIGDGCGFRPHCAISATESIILEEDVVMAMGCSVVDSDHTVGSRGPNVLHNPLKTAPIRIGRGTWLGDRVSVLRGSTIGEFCVIGANSVVRGEIPPYSVAVGAPARVVRTRRPE
jgi:lipopolysaccharide O-acetyltransferase